MNGLLTNCRPSTCGAMDVLCGCSSAGGGGMDGTGFERVCKNRAERNHEHRTMENGSGIKSIINFMGSGCSLLVRRKVDQGRWTEYYEAGRAKANHAAGCAAGGRDRERLDERASVKAPCG